MHKIGVIGPAASVNHILNIAKELGYQFELLPFTYLDPQEVPAMIEQSWEQVNGWLFSGPLPYLIAVESLGTTENFYYCPRTETMFLNCCLQMAYQKNKPLQSISVDAMEFMDVEQWLQAAGISIPQIHVKQCDSAYNYQQVIDFHLHLWNSAQIEGVITITDVVYRTLKKAGVTVYHLIPTKMEIWQSLLIVDARAQWAYFRAAQIALIIIQIDSYEDIVSKVETAYELQGLDLKVKQALLAVCQRLNGYLVDRGNGCYGVFSSRGAIEHDYENLCQLMHQFNNELSIAVNVGIGFGQTVFAAEINARRAVQSGKGAGVVVQDENVVVEFLGKNKKVSYAYATDDSHLLERLANANVGVRTYRKVESIVKRMKWQLFSVEQLAEQMFVTSRNIRRILAGLVLAGLVEEAGEEVVASRGRPRKLYRMIDKE